MVFRPRQTEKKEPMEITEKRQKQGKILVIT